MAISWANIRSLLLFFGPLLLPKAIGYYRSVRYAPRQPGITIQPVPIPISRCLTILFSVAVIFFIRTLPVFAPENIFRATQSRLQAPVDVLFSRLTSLRKTNTLSPLDEALRARFVSLDSRLLYLQYGPDVVALCPFCTSDDPKSYFYYALPALIVPHLANLAVIALVTSSLSIFAPTNLTPGASSRGAAAMQNDITTRWRRPATIAAIALCCLDLYAVNSYNYTANAQARRLSELDPFFWSARLFRYLGLAALDALLGWVLWLTATNRAFVRGPSPADRVAAATAALVAARGKLGAVGISRNTALRDDELRARTQAYWSHEVRLMHDVMEEREVIEGVNDALENRINIDAISRDADEYANGVLASLQDTIVERSQQQQQREQREDRELERTEHPATTTTTTTAAT